MPTTQPSNARFTTTAGGHPGLHHFSGAGPTAITGECRLFATTTEEQSEAARRLLAEYPALHALKPVAGLPPLDPVQALALVELIGRISGAPKVLEIGHGPWAPVLAILVRHRGGAFWSTGVDAWRTRNLGQRLKDAGAVEAVHLSTTRLAAVTTLGMAGRFPELEVLGPEADFNFVFVSADEAVREHASILHALPAAASRLSLDGFKLLMHSRSAAMQEVAATTWNYLAEELDFEEEGCAGLGLIVSGG